jgi:hypothetical protein
MSVKTANRVIPPNHVTTNPASLTSELVAIPTTIMYTTYATVPTTILAIAICLPIFLRIKIRTAADVAITPEIICQIMPITSHTPIGLANDENNEYISDAACRANKITKVLSQSLIPT